MTGASSSNEMPLFAAPDSRQAFPAPIAVTLEVMVSEIEESGEATTADETAAAIEATFLWLGRVWVAEYLHAIERDASWADEGINQDLVERAASSRGVTTGRWVGLARRIRAQLSGYETVVAGLESIPFGEATGQLLHFRNHFSHGSFASTVAEIRAHRQLLHDLLARVPALRAQLPYCRDAETGVVRLASGDWPEATPPAGEPLPEAHPVIVSPDGRRLDLYPLMHAATSDSGLALKAPDRAHPASQLTERVALAAWLERYAHHQAGYLPYASRGAPADLDEQTGEALRASLSGLVLVEAHPGCGGGDFVEALTSDDPWRLGVAAFDAVRRTRVVPRDLGQSGLTLARTLLRMSEEALGEPAGARQASAAELCAAQGPLQAALQEVAAAGKRLLLGVEDLHLGREAYRGEPLTVLDVYESLVDSPVTVVATTLPGALRRPLFDHKLEVPVRAAPDLEAVRASVDALSRHSPLHGRVLRGLSADRPLHLFALCDALEAEGGEAVFEPAVERALWDLRPLLRCWRDEVEVEDSKPERVRLWRHFSPAVTEVLGGAV